MPRQPNGQGGVIQRKDGRWQVSIQLAGVRKVTYAKTETQAYRKLAELRRKADTGMLPNPGKRTVNDLLDLWLEAAKGGIKPTTLDLYERTAAKHVRPALGKVRLSKLEPAHLQRLYPKLPKRTANRVHLLLHRACGLGVQWGWLDHNPAERVLAPIYSPQRREVWTPDELRHFLEGTNASPWWPIWTVAVCTGCRIGELLALKWAAVNPECGTIRVKANLQRLKGEWLEMSPKTKAGERSITLPAEGIAALRRQKAQQAEWRLKAGVEWHDSGYVFTTLTGGPVLRTTIAHAMARECRRLGVLPVTPHGLRHLHASLLLKQRLPVPAVSARLGHSRPSTTMSIYAHEIGDGDREAAEAIGRALAR